MYRSVLALLFASVLLLAYFYVIDPTVQNRQGNDRGSQYQTGVYFTNQSARETVKRIAEIERGRSEKFFVEIGPLKNFYPAEEYHQNYLEKNPNGYCHIPRLHRGVRGKVGKGLLGGCRPRRAALFLYG